MQNKRAQVSMGMIIVIALLVIGGVVVYTSLGGKTVIGGTSAPTSDGGGCEIAPVITVAAHDAINKGTAVTVTPNAKVNGGSPSIITSGTTTFSKGDSVELMYNATNFIDTIVPAIALKCGDNRVEPELYATATQTFRVFNDLGVSVTDDANGGATNQTGSNSLITMDVEILSNPDQSSGDLVIVVESTNGTEVSDLVLAGAGASKTTVPEFYTTQGAAGITRAYNVPAVKDGDKAKMTLQITPKSGVTMGTGLNSVYITAYSKQAFANQAGAFEVGVEDILDNSQEFEDNWDFDFSLGNI